MSKTSRVKIYDPDGVEFIYEFKSSVAFQGHMKHLFENLIEYTPNFQNSSLKFISNNNGWISSHYGLQEASSGLWIEDSNDSKFQKEDNILFFKLRPLNKYLSDVESLLPPTPLQQQIQNQPTFSQTLNSLDQPQSQQQPQQQTPPTSIRSHIENQIQNQFKIRAATLTSSNNNNNYNSQQQQQSPPSSKADKKALRKAIESLHIHLSLLMLKERTRNDHVFISSDNLVKIIRIIFRSPTLWAINLLVGYLERNNSLIGGANSNNNNDSMLKTITTSILNNNNGGNQSTDTSPSTTLNKAFSRSNGRSTTVTGATSASPAINSTSASTNLNNSNNSTPNSSGYYSKDSLGHNDSSGNQISLYTLIDQCIKTCSSEFKKSFYLYLLEQYEQRRDSMVGDDTEQDDIYFNKALRSSSSRSLSSSLLSIPNLNSEIIIQTISLINNIYLLSPNPVNYITKLHKDNIFKSLYELKIKDNLIANSIQYITLRNNIMNELKDQCNEKIDTERIQHQILFSDLWSSTLTLYPYGGCSSYKWLLLGFRGANPSDDLSCTGVISLRNLNYFAKQHTSLFKYLLTLQTDRELNQDDDDEEDDQQRCQSISKSYPVALVGISLSYLLSEEYGFRQTSPSLNDKATSTVAASVESPSSIETPATADGADDTTPSTEEEKEHTNKEQDDIQDKWNIVFSDCNWFDECYVSTFILFESLWSLNSISYCDFSTILSLTRSIIKSTIKKKPTSSQEFDEFIISTLLESNEISNAKKIVKKFIKLVNYSSENDIAYSCHHLIRFFGESLDSLSYQFLPPNLIKPISDSLQERNNRIETFQGDWLSLEQVEYNEKIRFSVQIQESLLTASLKNNDNKSINNVNGSSIHALNKNNSLNNSNPSLLNGIGSNSQMDSSTARLNKLNKFFGEKVPISKLNSSNENSPIVQSTQPPSNNNNSSSTTNNSSANIEQIELNKQRSPEELKSIDKVQRLLGERIDFKKENISFYKLHKQQQPPSPVLESTELLPSQPIQSQTPPAQQQLSLSVSPSSPSTSPGTGNQNNKGWRKVNANKSNYHASVIIPLSSPSTSPADGIAIENKNQSTSSSNNNSPSTPTNNADISVSSDFVNTPISGSVADSSIVVSLSAIDIDIEPSDIRSNFTTPTIHSQQTTQLSPPNNHKNLLNESVDNNPPSCRASINSSLETLDVISDQSSIVDEDDKLHVFYHERFDIEQQLQHSQLESPQELQPIPSSADSLQSESKEVSVNLDVQSEDDLMEIPNEIPATTVVEKLLSTFDSPKLKSAPLSRTPSDQLNTTTAPTPTSSPRLQPESPRTNPTNKPLSKANHNNGSPTVSPIKPKPNTTNAKSLPSSPLTTSPTLSSSTSTPRLPADQHTLIGGQDSPIRVVLRKTSLPQLQQSNSSSNLLDSGNSASTPNRPRAQTSKLPQSPSSSEIKKVHVVNDVSEMCMATNDHSPSVSSLISVFGEKIQRRG